MKYNQRGKGGFTLVELAVVLAAVLIIASIVYPIFARPRGCGSPQTQCTSNVKQLALGIQMYSQDNGSQYPGIDGSGWVSKVAPYLGHSTEMFRCPSDANEGVVSYAMAGLLIREDGSGVKESQVISPSEVGALCDAAPSVPYPNGRVIGGGALQAFSAIGAEPELRHSKGVVIGYVDGHAKYFQGDIDKKNEENGAVRALYHAAPLGLIDNPAACIPNGCEIAGLSGTIVVGGEYVTRPFLMAAGLMYSGNYYSPGFKGQFYVKGRPKESWVWGTVSTDPRRMAGKAIAYDAVCIIVAKGSKIPFLPSLDNQTYAVTISTIRRLFETGYQQNTVQVYHMPGAWCNTNAYVKKVIGNTHWGVDSVQVADDAEMIEKITNDPYGIGYCSSAFADPDRVVVLAPIIRGNTYTWPRTDAEKRWVMPSRAESDWPWKRSLDVTSSNDALGRGIAAALRTGPLMKKGLYGGPLFTWGYWEGNY
jgi:prepilin-type N-terminal cleavage/methylation domain-containing protein/prepilin-type processing-associated H-X9-DG protein